MKYPLGIGPGQFEKVSPISAHSTYVRALSEEGVLGLLVLLALLLLTLMFASRNAILGRDTYGIGSAALLRAALPARVPLLLRNAGRATLVSTRTGKVVARITVGLYPVAVAIAG